MINRMILVAALVITVSYGANSGSAVEGIGYINLPELLEKMPEAKAANDKLQLDISRMQRALKSKIEDYKKTEEKIKNGGSTMTEGAKTVLLTQAEKQQRAIIEYQGQIKKEINEKQIKYYGPIDQKIKKATESIAKKNKLNIILGQDAMSTLRLLYVDPKTNITSQAIKKLSKK